MRTWNTLSIALSLALGFGTASAAQGPFADLDNDGVFSDGDVDIEAMVEDDGYFSTSELTEGRAGIVVPGKVSVRTRALVLVASGDITVDGNLSANGAGAVIFLMSNGGNVTILPGTKINTASILQVVAAGDVEIGDRSQLRAKSHDFSMISVASARGDVNVGGRCSLGASTMVEITTQTGSGGDVNVGPSTRVWGGNSMRVTAGKQVMADESLLSADAILLGSHSGLEGRTAGGAGMVSAHGADIHSRNGTVHIFAEGDGGVIDLTGASVDAPGHAVVLDADVVVQ
jgi:hypothetical protein